MNPSTALAIDTSVSGSGTDLDASERVLVYAPTGRDGELTCRILDNHGLTCHLCSSCDELAEEIPRGAGLVLLGSESFDGTTAEELIESLERQPVWSDLPILVLTRTSDDSARVTRMLGPSANLTLLERPVWRANLSSTVQAAVRARRRQYEVRDLVHRLAESDRLKDEFLAMLGHELRNPLNAITTGTAILGEGDGGEATVERQSRMIERQARHLSRMVDDLLDLSRLSLGKIELQAERLDLVEMALGAVETVEMAGLRGDRRLETSLGDEPVEVSGDPLRVEQVIVNLLQNALKYTPDGGRVELSIAREDGEARLRVEDDGMGIAPEALEAIFDPFTQMGRAHGPKSSTAAGGLGVGLYLARRLADLHGGRLEVESEGLGEGSAFTFSLPLLEADAATGGERPGAGRARQRAAASRRRDPLQVLLVEDNDEGREAMTELLRIWGCTVVAAATGEEGVERALEAPPRLALIDIGLPDIDGYEVARRIRAELNGGDYRLIALTGFGQPEDRRRALKAGFDEHMVKPVDPPKLAELLDTLREAGGAQEPERLRVATK